MPATELVFGILTFLLAAFWRNFPKTLKGVGGMRISKELRRDHSHADRAGSVALIMQSGPQTALEFYHVTGVLWRTTLSLTPYL